MIYEIGWSSYDIIYIIIMLCFIPLLITFILFQKRYDTSTDTDEKHVPYAGRGSKSHTKFMITLLFIFLMLASLSPIMDLYKKSDAINCYKNGEYETFTGTAAHLTYGHITLIDEPDRISFETNNKNKEIKSILQNDIKDGETYTIYFTYTISEFWDTLSPENILRIDKAN